MSKNLRFFCAVQLALVLFVVANLPRTEPNSLVVTADAQTTSISIAVPTAILPDLVAAFDARLTRLPSELPANASNNAAFVKRGTRTFWSNIINQNRRDTASITLTVPDDLGN